MKKFLTFWKRGYIALWQRWLVNLIPSNKVFINHTGLSDDTLMSWWKNAQRRIATEKIYLNPVTVLYHPDTPKVFVDPNPLAYQIQPKNVYCTSVRDVLVSELAKVDSRWATHSNPSGTIWCDDSIQTCVSYVKPYHRPRCYVAKSREQLEGALGWEFENIILDKLGYDTSGR